MSKKTIVFPRELVDSILKFFPFFIVVFSVISCGCAPSQPFNQDSPLQSFPCNPPITSLNSIPGREWMREHGWRYKNDEEALKAYLIIIEKTPIWPDWYKPVQTTLKPGTRFQMILAQNQPIDKPGDFGTFDNISTPQIARENLAIRADWKNSLARVVIYEVTKPLPVKIGPVSTQIDSKTCSLLPGKWSQIEFLVQPSRRINFMIPVAVRDF